MSTFSAYSFLKTVFLTGIHDQFADNNVFLSNLDRNSDHIPTGGSTATWAIRDSRNSGVGAYPTGGPFPTAGVQGGAQPTQVTKNFAGSVTFDLKLMKQAKTDKQAFVKYTADEMERSLIDFKADLNRQILNGPTLGTVGSIDGSGVVTLSTTATPRPNPVTLYFQDMIGAHVTVYQSDGTTVRIADTTVTAFSDANGTVTIASFASVGAGDIIARLSSTSTVEMTSIRSIIGTGDIYGVSASTHPRFKGNVLTTPTDPTEAVLGYMRTLGAKNNAKYKFALTSWGAQLNYVAIMADRKRAVNTVDLKGGYDIQKDADDKFSGPEFAGVGPILADNYISCGTGANTAEFLFIDPNAIFFQQAGEADWMEDDKGNMMFPVANSPAFNSFYVWFADLCAYQRNGLVRHTAINEMVAS